MKGIMLAADCSVCISQIGIEYCGVCKVNVRANTKMSVTEKTTLLVKLICNDHCSDKEKADNILKGQCF